MDKNRHIIVGTAGHIDHGKTALIKALTGYDADRLEEEKRRGITIELGFTEFTLPDGSSVGIVDTPGHEKFVKTMVAGAMGMDMVLVVVSGTEGIKEQTREHLHILELLHIQRIIVVMTKIDMISIEQREQRRKEIRDYLAKTIWKDADIVLASSKTREGIEEVIHCIEKVALTVEKKPEDGEFVLPIDRVFSIAGYGTVVTGTLLQGVIDCSTKAMIYPKEHAVRIRNIQVHGKDIDKAYAGERVALNLSDMEKKEIKRGSLLARAGSITPSTICNAKVKVDNDDQVSIKNHSKLELLVGTAHMEAKIVLIDQKEVENGESAWVQLQLNTPIAVRAKERFILRNEAAKVTVAGGMIVDPNPARKYKKGCVDIDALQTLEMGDANALLYEKIVQAGGDFLEITKEQSMVDFSDRVFTLEVNKKIYAISKAYFMQYIDRLDTYFQDFYEKNPYKLGQKQMVIHQQVFRRLKKDLYLALCNRLVEMGKYNVKDDILSLAGHRIVKDERYIRIANQLVNSMQRAQFVFLKLGEIPIDQEDQPYLADVLLCMLQKHTIIRLENDYYTLGSIYKKLLAVSKEQMEIEGKISIDVLREKFGISRKNAKLFFACTDREKVTRFDGFESERTPYIRA